MMEYRETIRRFIIDNFLFEEESQLRDTDSLLYAGVIDSTGVLELIFFLETTYQLMITPAELTPENMDSIEKISHFIERKCVPQAPLANAPEPTPFPVEPLSTAAKKG